MSSHSIDLRLLPGSARVDAASGRMTVGGCDLVQLAEEFGTPLFVYDELDIRERCRTYRDAFRGNVAYASKAFLCRAMVRIIDEEGLDLDVASGGEFGLAVRAGMPTERIILHGNNKSVDELRAALSAGVKHVVVDSDDELDRIEHLVRDEGLAPPKVLVRVNPGVDAHTHEYLATGAIDSKFGFSMIDGVALRAVTRIVDSGAAVFDGLHVHIGSQIFERAGFVAALERLAVLIADIERSTGVELAELNLGGGLGIAYVTSDDPPAIGPHAAAMQEDLAAALTAADVRSRPALATEPGRSIVGTAGVTLYRVGTIKTVVLDDSGTTNTYVSVDGGMSDNPRPALYGAQYEAFVPARAAAARDRRVTLAGKHCEQGDLLARDAALPADLAVGDVVCVPVTGAYGYSMASNYNKLGRPAVVFVADGVARVVIRRESLDDLVRLDQA